MSRLQELANEVAEEEKTVKSDGSKKNQLTDILSTSRPIQKTGDPIIDKLLFLQKEIVSPLAQGANTAAFGLPKFIANKLDPEMAMQIFAQQSTLGGKALRFGSEAAGYIGGGASKLGQGAATATGKALTKKLGTSGLASKTLSNILSGAVGGAVGGASQITDPEASYRDLMKRQSIQAGGGALAGAAMGAALPIIRGIKNLKYVTDDDVGAKTMKAFRDEFANIKTKAVETFGNQLDDLASKNPTRTVDLTNTIDDIKSSLDDMPPEARNALKKVPLIKNLLEKPVLKDRVPLKDVQDAINYMNTKIPKNIRSSHIDILDAVNDIRVAQLDAFPEMASVRADYAKTIEPYNQVKNYFKFNKLEKAIESGFGGSEGRKAVKQLMSPETISKLGGIREAQNVANMSSELIRNLVIGISSGVGAGMVFRQLNKQD